MKGSYSTVWAGWGLHVKEEVLEDGALWLLHGVCFRAQG